MIKWIFIKDLPKIKIRNLLMKGRNMLRGGDAIVKMQVNIKFVNFSNRRENLADIDSLNDRGKVDEKTWWII